MIGVLSQDNIEIVGHSLFKNYRQALINYIKQPFIFINNIDDLNLIDTLFIIDEHYIPHKELWCNDVFINNINSNNIKVIIFNFEKINNSQFPWNIHIQNQLTKINRYIQYVADINDSLIYETPITKQYLSKDTCLVPICQEKQNKILFIGQINEYYPTRGRLIRDIKQHNSSLEVIKTDRKMSYKEFLDHVNSARFILNPLGTGEFINLRFYEALQLGCIVVQQYTDKMEDVYTEELNNPNVLKFKDVEDFLDLSFDIQHVPYTKTLEEYFEEIGLNSSINKL